MTRILVLGNAGLDLSLVLPRLPSAGETLMAGRVTRAPGAKGLNQAVTAARAGGYVAFAAPVGEDAEANFVATALGIEPLASTRLIRLPEPTDLSVLMVAADGENSIVTAGACAAALTADAAASFAGDAEPGDLLLLQGNLSAAASLAAAEIGARRGARLMVNAAPILWPLAELLRLSAVFVVNAVEAADITGQKGEVAAADLHAQGAALAVVTLGAAGCVCADATGVRRYAAHPAVVMDTTGAGDAFCGVLAAMLADGAEVDTAIDVAQAAAALTVSRPGAFTALPSVTELTSLLCGRQRDTTSHRRGRLR